MAFILWHSSSENLNMQGRWRALILRSLIATAVAWIIASVPLPAMPAYRWFAFVQVPLVVFLLICYLGKLLIDTFFYNHYQP